MKKTLTAKDVKELPAGVIPKCPNCDADCLTVSMSNTRPTKVWCNDCGFCQHLEKEAKKGD